jgi:hypothetical protein
VIRANATYTLLIAIALATRYMTADEQHLNGLGSAARARPGALPAGRPSTVDAKQHPALGRKNGAGDADNGQQRIKIGLTMRSIRTVSTDLVLWLVASQQTVRPLVARFSYSHEDPYAIRVAFRVEQDRLVEWVFARDLLSIGMKGREGLGDVTVWPSAGSGIGASGRVLNIKLSSPFGQAHFEASVKEISEFLRQTHQIVPPGEESELVDFDAELTDLLRRGVG